MYGNAQTFCFDIVVVDEEGEEDEVGVGTADAPVVAADAAVESVALVSVPAALAAAMDSVADLFPLVCSDILNARY